MKRTKVKHFFLLTSGWTVLVAGLLILPIPVPLPFPAAAVLLLIGTAILSAHSRSFRHAVQYARHRYRWLSRSFETFGTRAPESVRKMVRRTRPDLIARHARRRAARPAV